ncbi:hypothetical protein JW948_04585 [bacterium]|nr:hypothetical protein [bacterium]
MKHLIITGLVLISVCGSALWSQESKPIQPSGDNANLTLPWQEFRNMLHLDDKQIVIGLDTFEKLLKQTDVENKPAYSVKDGNVILSRQAFDELVSRMKPPQSPGEMLPFEYLITKALYRGRMHDESTAFEGIFTVHVLKKEGYVRVPVLPQNMALESVTIDHKDALVISENGFHTLLFKAPGTYQVRTLFSIQSSLDKGPHRIDLNIQKTPMTLLELTIPMKNIDVEIPQAQHLTKTVRDSRTQIASVLTPGNQISIRWRKQLAVTEKIPPKLYAEMHHLISIEDDALKTGTDVILNILHSEIENVRIAVPEGMNILSVSGEGVGEWQEITESGRRILIVPFTYSKMGQMIISMLSEIPFSAHDLVAVFKGLQVPDAVRETGFIGVELNTSAEIKVTESSEVEPIPIEKLPSRLYEKSRKPMILGFKYLRHPYHITLGIEKHEKIAVPMATIESANAVTLFTEDGKVVHRLVYQVRNSAKQFIELTLPETADIWSVFVGDEPVESSVNRDGDLLIPLIRSRSVNNRLEPFPVEIILCAVREPFSTVNNLNVTLPGADLLTSQIMWSLYLPNDYQYMGFESTLEKEEMLRDITVFKNTRRTFDDRARQKLLGSSSPESRELPAEELQQMYEGREYKSKFRNVPMDEEQMQSQVENELRFSQRLDDLVRQEPAGPSAGAVSTGVLPIQIRIPTSGQVYRFAKTIVKPEDPLNMHVTCIRQWIVNAVKWIFWLLVLFVLILFRKTVGIFLGWLKNLGAAVPVFYNTHRTALLALTRARLMPFICFGLAMLLFIYTDWFFLGGLLVFLCIILLIDRLLRYLDTRKKK